MKIAVNQRQKHIQSKDKLLAIKIEKNRQDMSLKSMQFNRFMLIRYATAIFFFVNLYWALIMRHTWVVIIPVIVMFVSGLAIVEQIKLFGQHTNQLIYSKLFFRTQLVVNIGLIISTMTPLFPSLFQFVNNTSQNRYIVLVSLLLGAGAVLFVNKRLTLIASNRDKYYSRLMAYQAILKKNKEMN
ncbi:sugar transporter [Leuconostoc inhae]|uniref:sugar transporter n=1 Tax=Leuconostoc inhae TaxID=178001 RepID=UPI001C7DF713|nr:sugar transporter [Leuconostoc inhae]